jgi:transcription elongation GreA/GreB family factor
MPYYFLKNDFDELKRQIWEVNRRIKAIGQEMGASCQEGAETFHDNFAYEDGERQQRMWSQRLRELLEIYENAQIFNPSVTSETVAIGRSVTVFDYDTEEEKTFNVGSYMCFNGNDTISYNAPLAKILLGASVGDVRKGKIAGKKKELEIIDIQ